MSLPSCFAGKSHDCPNCGEQVPVPSDPDALETGEQVPKMISMACPECSAIIQVDKSLAGTNAPCPKCGRRIPIPDVQWTPKDETQLQAATKDFVQATVALPGRSANLSVDGGETAREKIVHLMAKKSYAGEVPNLDPNDPAYQAKACDDIRRAAHDAQLKAFLAQAEEHDPPFTWITVNGADACKDCQGRHGRTKRLSQWQDMGMPGDGHTACKRSCQCQFVPAWKRKLAPVPSMTPTGGPLDRAVLDMIDQWDELSISQMQGISLKLGREHGEVAEHHLACAIIEARVASELKSPDAVADRWQKINDPSYPGLPTAIRSPDYQRTYAFVAGVFVRRFKELMEDVIQKAEAQSEKRKTPKAKANCWTRAKKKIEAAREKFSPELMALAEHAGQLEKFCEIRMAEDTSK